PTLYAAAAAPWRRARGQIAARMRVPFDLHDAQRRAAAARHGDRNPGPAVAGGGGEVRRPQPRPARSGAGVGGLGDAAAISGGNVRRGRAAADEGATQDRAAADRQPRSGTADARARRPGAEQDPRKKPAVRSAALTFR